ncbi:MAG: tRNA (cytidine(56)-2'-O)-methyltransferase [Candidatus Altiarchaeota archaeon]|nr:tRNA (cytidine(56)-2'-O)-methyltransferase [Candidatus Altiarchaeota archaeon]
MAVSVLRLGHRFARDARISTHVALTARAFGAEKIAYDAKATDVKESVEDVVKQWGGSFTVEFTDTPMKYLKSFTGLKVHLTMYGLSLNEVIGKITKRGGDLLVVVGGKKVPSEVYELVDYNVSVGTQPHSEVAALAVFLDRYFRGGEVDIEYKKAKLKVVPQAKGKKVLSE